MIIYTTELLLVSRMQIHRASEINTFFFSLFLADKQIWEGGGTQR